MTQTIRLAELIEALSHALDMTEGQPAGHCVRCCFIGTRIGQALGLDEESLRDLYYTLLLKDLGCSSNAARICELYLADDLKFKRDFKLVDGSFPQILKFVLSHTGMEAGLAERFRGILHIFKNGGEISTSLSRPAVSVALKSPARCASPKKSQKASSTSTNTSMAAASRRV